MWRTLAILLIGTLDLASYCKGICQARYQDGTYLSGKCACIDYQDLNLKQRFESPKKRKQDFDSPKVYYGTDEMHVAPADPPPTADFIF